MNVRRLEGGHRNEVFLVARGGVRLVAKTTRRSEAAVLWLNEVFSCAEQAGFVVPRFVPSSDGRVWVNGVTLETYLPGDPVDKRDLPALLPMLKAFHALTAELPQRPGFASATDLLGQPSGGDVDLKRMPADLVEACRAAWQGLSGLPRAVVHGDLNPANSLRTPDGRIALLDWDEARVDAQVFDTAALEPSKEPLKRALLAWEVAVCWTVEPTYARRLAKTFVATV